MTNAELDLCENCDGMLMVEPPEDAEDESEFTVHCYGCGDDLIYVVQEVRYLLAEFSRVKGENE